MVPEGAVVPVTEVLAASGVFHLSPPELLHTASKVPETDEWRRWATSFASLERRILAVMQALGADEGSPPAETPHLIWPEVAEMDVEHLEEETQAPVHELEEEQDKLARLQSYITHLAPLAELDVDLGTLRNMRYTYVLPGTVPLANVERLRSSLEHIPFVLVELQRMAHLATVVLFGLQSDADILDRASRSAYLNPLRPPETYRGTPAEALAALQSSIERAKRHIAEFQATLQRLRSIRIDHLRHLLWRVRASRKLSETIASFGRLHYTYLVNGWVPASKVALLEQMVASVSDQVMIEVSSPRREEETPQAWSRIPVALENPPLLRAFQGLVTNYGQPRYGELDPTPIMALTYPLVFGVMFGDVGQGLLLVLLGLLLVSGRVRFLRELAGLGVLLAACGLAATVFGFLYGSLFGFEGLFPPLWIRPLDNIIDILIASVVMGVGLLSVGMLHNTVNAALEQRWGRLLFRSNGLAGIVFYWSLVGLGARVLTGTLPVSPVLLAALAVCSGLAVMFSEVLGQLVDRRRPLFEGSFGAYLMQALFELFETVLGLLSNTLSYIRMGAFAVAHGTLSLVVFILADTFSPARGVGYWIVVALGNVFVIGFEGMIVGIQTLRLEYYEFFSKFFSGSGVPHRPLALISREEA